MSNATAHCTLQACRMVQVAMTYLAEILSKSAAPGRTSTQKHFWSQCFLHCFDFDFFYNRVQALWINPISKIHRRWNQKHTFVFLQSESRFLDPTEDFLQHRQALFNIDNYKRNTTEDGLQQSLENPWSWWDSKWELVVAEQPMVHVN